MGFYRVFYKNVAHFFTSFYFWIAIAFGMVPVILWCAGQWWYHIHTLSSISIMEQSLSYIHKSVESNNLPPWLNILEILKYTWPWLLFLPQALCLCWQNKNLSWAKLILVWMGMYLLFISIIHTKIPWSVYPIYPSIALAIGVFFSKVEELPPLSCYPRFWVVGLVIIAIATCGTNIYYLYYPGANNHQIELHLILTAATITMRLDAILAHRRDRQFLKVLIWVTYLSLLLLMQSNHWI